MSPLRVSLPAALVAILLVALVGCSSGSSDAAVVNGQAISNSDFEKELSALADNAALESEAEARDVAFVVDGELSPALQASWLTEVINSTIVEQGVEDENVEVTDADRADAEAGVTNLFGSQEVIDDFPDWFRDLLIERQANVVALTWHLAGGRVGDDEASKRAFFDETLKAEATAYCARHILVDDEAVAQDLSDQVKAGADFATLAAQNSTDTGSAPSGGDLGCQPAATYVEPFAEALVAQTVGQVGDPVQSDFGWHVILVDSVQEPTYEDYAANIDEAIQEYGRTQLNTWLVDATKNADITINSKYGELVNEDGQLYVSPPVDDSATNLTPDTGSIDTAPVTVPATAPATTAAP